MASFIECLAARTTWAGAARLRPWRPSAPPCPPPCPALARAGSEGTAGSGGSDGSGGGGPQLLPRVVLGPVLWMEVILEQLEDPLGTAVTLSKLLSASRVMLAKYATPKLVGRFAEMIRLLGPQRRLVDFFTAICLVRSQLSDGDRTK